jgi:hypothetical protein
VLAAASASLIQPNQPIHNPPQPDFLHDYIFLTVGRVGSSTDLIAQHVEFVQQDQKRETVLDCVKMVEVRLCAVWQG